MPAESKSCKNCFSKLALILASLALIPATTACAGSNILVGERVADQRRVPIDRIDHSVWDALLRKYVDEAGLVDYQGWKNSSQDRQRLATYLGLLSTADLSAKSSRPAQLSYWINAYNAVTIEGILRVYPTTSIRNHTAKLFGYNIWDDHLLQVSGRTYSLNQIEHDVLRKMNEPRIHFAIVCASIGCPRLLNRAYVSETLDVQLEGNAKHFFANPGNFQITGKTVRLSAILDWFAEDFGESTSDRLGAILRWLPDESVQRLRRAGRVSVEYLEYDWTLNQQP